MSAENSTLDVKFFQELADEITRLHPVPLSLEVRLDEDCEGDQGQFYVEQWEDEEGGETPADTMIVSTDQFEDWEKVDLVNMLRLHVFIHEMAHALQFRGMDFEEQREEDHDSEFGIKLAFVHRTVASALKVKAGQGFLDDIGLTTEARERIISTLADAIEKGME